MSGAFLIPLSHAIILDTYPTEEHGKAMALWGMGSVCGSVIGPTVGGYLTEYASWRWIYYINIATRGSRAARCACLRARDAA